MNKRDEYLCKEMRFGWKRVWTAETFPPEMRVGHYPEGFFATWAGFGVLWAWCVRQPWWEKSPLFRYNPLQYNNPDNFATELYQHLLWFDLLDNNR